jgi:hypothetical protein
MSSRPGHVPELVHENGEYIQSIWGIMLVGALVAGADVVPERALHVQPDGRVDGGDLLGDVRIAGDQPVSWPSFQISSPVAIATVVSLLTARS